MEGIRNVISAALMRPMMAARNSQEAAFTQRAWRWGLSSARARREDRQNQGRGRQYELYGGFAPFAGLSHDSPLADGQVIGTRELLRLVHQRNLAEEDLARLVQLTAEEITVVRSTLRDLWQESSRPTIRS